MFSLNQLVKGDSLVDTKEQSSTAHMIKAYNKRTKVEETPLFQLDDVHDSGDERVDTETDHSQIYHTRNGQI